MTLDELLEIGCYFDWITPLYAEIRDVVDGGYPVLISRESDLPAVRRLLRGYDAWGMMIVSGHLFFSIQEDQAAEFCELLAANGIEIDNNPKTIPPRPLPAAQPAQQPGLPLAWGMDQIW